MISSFDFGSVRAVIIENGKILLVKEKNEDVWETPGGRIHKNDGSPEEALKREVLEETGYDCDVKEIVDFVILSPEWARGRVFHVLYKAELKEKVKEPEKGTEQRWFSKEEVKTMLKNGKVDKHDIGVFKRFVENKI